MIFYKWMLVIFYWVVLFIDRDMKLHVPPEHRAEICHQVEDLITRGFMQENRSPYVSCLHYMLKRRMGHGEHA